MADYLDAFGEEEPREDDQQQNDLDDIFGGDEGLGPASPGPAADDDEPLQPPSPIAPVSDGVEDRGKAMAELARRVAQREQGSADEEVPRGAARGAGCVHGVGGGNGMWGCTVGRGDCGG